MIDLTTPLDIVRKSFNGSSCRDDRARIGQFLTPAKIARFMASLFHEDIKHVRMLDAGAGAGSLFAACVETVIARKRRPLSISIVAYENDQSILPFLKETMEHCELRCREAGITFHGEIRQEDFIAAAAVQSESRLFDDHHERFTHAILNPPYKKIYGQSTTRRLLYEEVGSGLLSCL